MRIVAPGGLKPVSVGIGSQKGVLRPLGLAQTIYNRPRIPTDALKVAI